MEDIVVTIVLVLMVFVALIIDTIYIKYIAKPIKDTFEQKDYLSSKKWKNKAKKFKEDFTK